MGCRDDDFHIELNVARKSGGSQFSKELHAPKKNHGRDVHPGSHRREEYTPDEEYEWHSAGFAN